MYSKQLYPYCIHVRTCTYMHVCMYMYVLWCVHKINTLLALVSVQCMYNNTLHVYPPKHMPATCTCVHVHVHSVCYSANVYSICTMYIIMYVHVYENMCTFIHSAYTHMYNACSTHVYTCTCTCIYIPSGGGRGGRGSRGVDHPPPPKLYGGSTLWWEVNVIQYSDARYRIHVGLCNSHAFTCGGE